MVDFHFYCSQCKSCTFLLNCLWHINLLVFFLPCTNPCLPFHCRLTEDTATHQETCHLIHDPRQHLPLLNCHLSEISQRPEAHRAMFPAAKSLHTIAPLFLLFLSDY